MGEKVTADISDMAVVAGKPCRVIRQITDEDRRYYYKRNEIDDEAWKNTEYYTGYYFLYDIPGNYIGSVLDNLYCAVWDDMAEHDGFSIVELDENMELTEVISDVNSNVFLSRDGRKLWCVSRTRFAYYDMSARKLKVQYCKEPCGMDTVDEQNGITIAKPFAAASDGSRICFIGTDGTLWMCTPDTLERPKAVEITDAAEVYCSAGLFRYIVSIIRGWAWQKSGAHILFPAVVKIQPNKDGGISHVLQELW